MELKDKIDCLRFLSRAHRSQFDERRKYEWKVVFTILTFYVLCVAGGYQYNIMISRLIKIVIWIIFLSLAGIISCFLADLHTANSKNKTIAEKAEDMLLELTKGNEDKDISTVIPPGFQSISWKDFFKPDIKGIWAWRWQVTILFIFAVVSSAFLSFCWNKGGI